MKNFSVLVNNLGSSQLSFFIIKEINALPALRPEIDGIVFYENLSSACLPVNFATMNMSECWCHSGPIVATSFSTAKTLSEFPSEKKMFYVWDLEWMRLDNFTHKELSEIYNNDSIELISRSSRHNSLIQKCWKAPSFIMDDFNYNSCNSS